MLSAVRSGAARSLPTAGLVLALTACNGASGGVEPPRLVDPERVDPAVAAAVNAAWQRAVADPASSEARTELGYTYDANGVHDLALASYADAVRLDPGNVRARYHLARMHTHMGAWEEALAVLGVVALDAPDYAPVHWRRAEILMDLARLDEAAAAYARATQANPRDPTGALGTARVQLQRGEYGAAAEGLRAVLAERPDDGWANGLLARAAERLGETALAEAARARESGTTHAWVDPWRDVVFEHAAGYADAVTRAKEHLQAGRTGEVLALAQPLLESYPRNVTLQGLLTAALVEEEKYDEALALLQRAAADQPDHYRIEMNLGIVFSKKGQLAESIRHLERALELNPQYGSGYAFLGEVLLGVGDWPAAAQALAAARRLGAGGTKAAMQLGRARANLGDFDGAAEAFAEAARSAPTAKSPWAYLALAHADAGRLGEARAALEELRRRDPQHAMLPDISARLRALEERGR